MAKKTANDSAAEPGFEQLLADAERLAQTMEDGGLSLDDSIKAFEQGMDNLRRSADLLRAAGEKVQVLLEKNGQFRLEDMDAPAEEEDDA